MIPRGKNKTKKKTGFDDQNRKSIEVTPLVPVRSPFRSAPVCKHASKARDPCDAFRTDVQSENGGVWAVGVACLCCCENVDGPRCRQGAGGGPLLGLVMTPGRRRRTVDGGSRWQPWRSSICRGNRTCCDRRAVGKSSPPPPSPPAEPVYIQVPAPVNNTPSDVWI